MPETRRNLSFMLDDWQLTEEEAEEILRIARSTRDLPSPPLRPVPLGDPEEYLKRLQERITNEQPDRLED